ncbi:uncharacterized protein HD556DRAFT_1443620 [Suillus plorans]|uniref:Uncharacterized protein n=1 Tax=Suillus plorans TaxID=116603 RepID=A0A9P7AP60_9AGAM|nr:uncharacterized protein HD556DRAFT_1443620 [Suillus plorans]KAG1793505.1 hypothetical protein HD556DRAFT_1443620 [Suillus plorans]
MLGPYRLIYKPPCFPQSLFTTSLIICLSTSKCQTLRNMQSNASSSKTPRRSIVRSLLQRITKKKDTKDPYPSFLDVSLLPVLGYYDIFNTTNRQVSAETEICQLGDDFFALDANDDLSSADK